MTLIAAAFASPVAHARVRNLALAFGLMCAAFLAANPYALLDHHGVPRRPRRSRPRPRARRAASSAWPTRTAGATTCRRSRGASAGCRRCSRSAAPAALIAAPPAARAAARARADPAVPLPRPPVALLRALDAADLPDPLPARGLRRRSRSRPACARSRGARRRRARRALVLAAGPRLQRPQRPRAGQGRHAHGRARLDGRSNIPAGLEDRRRADRARPVGDGRRAPALRGPGRDRQRQPLEQVAHVALLLLQRQDDPSPARARWSRSRTTSARRAPSWSATTSAAASASSSRARPSTGVRTRTRRTCPYALRYYDELKRRGRGRFRSSPYGDGSKQVPFSFDYSFNYYPLEYDRPGPRS